MTPDPIMDGVIEGLGGYTYCRNNPVRYIDPDGKEAVSLTIGGVTITAGAAVAVGAALTWSLMMITNKDFRESNIICAEYVSEEVHDAVMVIYSNTIGKIKAKTEITARLLFMYLVCQGQGEINTKTKTIARADTKTIDPSNNVIRVQIQGKKIKKELHLPIKQKTPITAGQAKLALDILYSDLSKNEKKLVNEAIVKAKK